MTINPHRITVALDRAKLVGPTADAKLGAVEPDLDMWEAGRATPSDAQLRKLARMANVPLEFFALRDDEFPPLYVARVCNRRTGYTVVTMPADPYGPDTLPLDEPAP
jgi:hypothetical protein